MIELVVSKIFLNRAHHLCDHAAAGRGDRFGHPFHSSAIFGGGLLLDLKKGKGDGYSYQHIFEAWRIYARCGINLFNSVRYRRIHFHFHSL
jgi:hypothetical protein